jgi:dolichol kinase
MFTLAKLRFVEFWRSNGVHSQLFGALLIGWGSLIASPFFDNRFFHISCALLFALAQQTCDRAASVCGARSGNRLLQRGISLTGPGRPLRLLR